MEIIYQGKKIELDPFDFVEWIQKMNKTDPDLFRDGTDLFKQIDQLFPVKQCLLCYWLDGFTGECIIANEKGTPIPNHGNLSESEPCHYQEHFRIGIGHCIDQHDLWRDSPYHKQNVEKYNDWKREAEQIKYKMRTGRESDLSLEDEKRLEKKFDEWFGNIQSR